MYTASTLNSFWENLDDCLLIVKINEQKLMEKTYRKQY